MLTKKFWRGAMERGVKTFMQATVAALLAVAGNMTTVWEVPWVSTVYDAVGIGLMATFLSVATSIGNADFVEGAPNDA